MHYSTHLNPMALEQEKKKVGHNIKLARNECLTQEPITESECGRVNVLHGGRFSENPNVKIKAVDKQGMGQWCFPGSYRVGTVGQETQAEGDGQRTVQKGWLIVAALHLHNKNTRPSTICSKATKLFTFSMPLPLLSPWKTTSHSLCASLKKPLCASHSTTPKAPTSTALGLQAYEICDTFGLLLFTSGSI